MIEKKIYYLFLIALLAGCANQHIDYSSHPLVGRWAWDVDGCIETYNFQKDGVRKGNSFREIVEAEYRVSIKPLDSGFYRLYDKVTYENGAEDCSGSTQDMTGDEVNVFVGFKDIDTIMFCFTENFSDCFGPFIRM